HEALVEVAGILQALDHRLVDVGALRLPVGRVGAALLDALVPVDAEPLERVDELQVALLGIAGGIRVFHAEDELAARVSGIGPVEECGAHHADVRGAGGRRAEPDAHIGTGRLGEGERHPSGPTGGPAESARGRLGVGSAQSKASAADAASASTTPTTCTRVSRSRSTVSASSTVPSG